MADGGIPVITSADPVVVAPQSIPGTTYNNLWLSSLVIQAFDVNKDASAFVELVHYTTLQDGTKQMAPSSSVQFKIDNLLTKAQTDKDLATVVVLLMNYLIKVGKEKGVVA